MEFVHTYGWIILSMIILSGVMIYYTMSNPAKVIPKECSFTTGIGCLDFQVDESLLKIEIVNKFGFAISNITANMTGTCNSTANTTEHNPHNNPRAMLMNMQETLTFECQNLTGKQIEEQIRIGYRSVESDQTHWKIGRLEYKPGE